jgi:hypothetical protein
MNQESPSIPEGLEGERQLLKPLGRLELSIVFPSSQSLEAELIFRDFDRR